MPAPVICKICGVRRARRDCPGVQGMICPLCCGTEREVTISCPLDCEYLREARFREAEARSKHAHEAHAAPPPMPHPDVPLTEDFLRKHNDLLMFCGVTLIQGALETPGAVDKDVEEALEALIRTQRTLESGLVYQTRAGDLVAAAVQAHMEKALEDYQKLRHDREGLAGYRTAEILGVLVFLLRLSSRTVNGRPRGRAFIDYLTQAMPAPPPAPEPGKLIL
jgi:hypothetical protein